MYIAKHKPNCKNKDCYIIVRSVPEKVDKRGVILSNCERGFITSVKCADCNAPAQWKD